jgi:hypothetical protein
MQKPYKKLILNFWSKFSTFAILDKKKKDFYILNFHALDICLHKILPNFSKKGNSVHSAHHTLYYTYYYLLWPELSDLLKFKIDSF